jgi:GntR family carbon starvation induced transcriptional regulator
MMIKRVEGVWKVRRDRDLGEKRPSKKPDDERDKTTLALSVYGKLKVEILGGMLEAGKKLKIRDICLEYGVGVSPVREALNRLLSERLVSQSVQRGFTVAEISIGDLEELALARRWLNELALRQSIEHGDEAWEERVIVGFHRLSRQKRTDANNNRNLEWDLAHRQFHSYLLDACGSRWMVEICDMLFDASERYRAIDRLAGDPMRDPLAEHRAIMDAVIDRNADQAVALLHDHFDRTTVQVRRCLSGASSKTESPNGAHLEKTHAATPSAS